MNDRDMNDLHDRGWHHDNFNFRDIHDPSVLLEHLKSLKSLNMLVIIIDRSRMKKVTDLLRKERMPLQFGFYAEGTVSSSMMNLLGLGSNERAVMLGFAPLKRIPEILSEAEKQLGLAKTGRGIAFSIPISGMTLPFGFYGDIQEKLHKEFESGASKVNEDLIEHDLIVAVVNEGRCDDVMKAAREAGASGGTTFHALRFGMEDVSKVFGFAIQEKKDIVTILTKRENKTGIMKSINEMLGIKSQSFVFSLPAGNVHGIGKVEEDQ